MRRRLLPSAEINSAHFIDLAQFVADARQG